MSITISLVGNVSRRSIQNILTASSKEEALNGRTWKQWFTDGVKYFFTLNMLETHFKQIDKLWNKIRQDSNDINDINKLCHNIVKLREYIVVDNQHIFDKSLRIKIQPLKAKSIKLYFVNSDETPVYQFSESHLDSLFCEDLQNELFSKIFKRYNIKKDINIYAIRENINFKNILQPRLNLENRNLKLDRLKKEVTKLEEHAVNYLRKTEKLCALIDEMKKMIEKIKEITEKTRKSKNKYDKQRYKKAHELKEQLKKYLEEYEPESCNISSIDGFIKEAEVLLKEAEDFILNL